ncbi:MAG: ABC transporter permease [Victivallaceae bacterium]|nr:ABC transporter permease [Victivallaceae bacterium]
MIFYLAKRLLLALATLSAILFVSYVLLRLAPGDPTRSSMLDSGENASGISEKGGFATNASLREELGLGRPIIVGFWHWTVRVVCRGDFGRSASVDPGRPVVELILERLPVTLTLNFWAIAVTYLLAIPLGVYSAVHARSWSDHAIEVGLFFLYSLPAVWVGLLLQSLFCEGGVWPVFPLQGAYVYDDGTASVWRLQYEAFKSYILPVICLSYGGFAGLSRYARSGMLDVLFSDYIRSARAKGVPECDVVWRHALRNALITLITLFGGLLPSLVAGSVIVEYIFNIPGMGNLALLALSSRDYPLQMALFFFSGALTLLGILIADLLYMAADPRIDLTK